MDASDNSQLSLSQKVRLAATVFAIYWPLRFYINLSSIDLDEVEFFWACIWLAEIPIIVGLFTSWISLTQWLENKWNDFSGRLTQLDAKVAGQLATLLIAAGLSVGFDWLFFQALHRLRQAFDQSQSALLHTPASSTKPPRFNVNKTESQRRHKATTALTVMALLMAYYLAANRRRDTVVARLQLKAEQLKREASQAQFEALKNQVDPHFLFNSLSILTSLVEINPKLSIRFISHLSRAYRYILDQRDVERISLKTELQFLEAYCFLVNIRFDGKFQLVNTISEAQSIRFAVAPLTLQLLMENAVKHNQMSHQHPLIVTLSVEGGYLRISNPIRLRLPDETFPEHSTGVGLSNITNRYRLLTDRPVVVTGQPDTFTVHIPLLP